MAWVSILANPSGWGATIPVVDNGRITTGTAYGPNVVVNN